jgi:hypothetical protein
MGFQADARLPPQSGSPGCLGEVVESSAIQPSPSRNPSHLCLSLGAEGEAPQMGREIGVLRATFPAGLQ